MQNFKELIKLANYKDGIDKKRADKKFIDPLFLLDEIVGEVAEVKEELKKNNRAYLEDELGDILWGWVNLVEKLKLQGYIDSHESIIKNALKKYEQRILSLKGDERDYQIWEDIKKKQKIDLDKKSFNA
jgi:NTP pyrophosphatase (non-canonical NTP hydrolase)